MRRSGRMFLLVLCASIGCSGSGPTETPPPSGALLEADLARYRASVEAGDHTSAIATGQRILRAHPGSPAAEEVERTLPEVEAKAAAAAQARRLAALWAYHTGTESGGAQSAASIFASQPSSGGERIRLILRRHAAWGVSAYLYGGGAGFSCSKPCSVALRFDGGPVESWPASTPATGEPAIFIVDHDGLAERIAGADRLEIDVSLVDQGPATIAFEVGGFDPTKWQPLTPR